MACFQKQPIITRFDEDSDDSDLIDGRRPEGDLSVAFMADDLRFIHGQYRIAEIANPGKQGFDGWCGDWLLLVRGR
jgi:hypothetical protein